MPNPKKSFSKKLTQSYLQNKILKLLEKNPKKRYHPASISRKLNVKNSKDSIAQALELMTSKRRVIADRHGKFSYNTEYAGKHHFPRQKLVGTVDMTANGGAYVVVNKVDRDIYVPKKLLNGALHMDTVEISSGSVNGYRRPEGRVEKVISRYRTSFLGVFRNFVKYGYVYVESRHVNIEIRVLPDNFNEAEDGDQVIVSVQDFGRPGHYHFTGEVKHVFSSDNVNDLKMNGILIENGFNIFFPEQVVLESKTLSMAVNANTLADREDFRDTWTCTIDPQDAKDFDDAISMKKLDNGHVEVGIHIADVSHYLKPGSELDREAYRRSTSVYLVDRVCPMLPEVLSNDLCSLKPEVDRFTFSAIVVLNDKGNIVDRRFTKSIIHSNRRFTYEEVQAILESGSGQYFEQLNYLNTKAKSLRDDRFKKGSIDFDSDEVKFLLDEEKVPIAIQKKERKDAHKLVEEYMLLANRMVAEFVSKKRPGRPTPFVYRIHDLPDPTRLAELALLASEFGVKLNLDSPDNIAESLNRMTSQLEGSELLSVLRPMAIRSMAKAEYSSNNVGHFGLGFKHYTHFTSPIRRYSDVLSHRILESSLKSEENYEKELESKCKHISKKERSAIDAERASIKYKQVEYLQDKIGQRFTGLIRAIIEKGIFVELNEIQIDGMVPFSRFEESYTVHPARIKAVGNLSGRELRIGNRVEVIVVNADLEKSQVDLAFTE